MRRTRKKLTAVMMILLMTFSSLAGSWSGEKGVVYANEPNSEDDFWFNSTTGTITGYKGTSKDVVIPEFIDGAAVRSIDEEAFVEKDLISVVIPEGVTSIGEGAFSYNRLTSVTLPESVTIIKANVFAENSLTSVVIPEGVTSIGEGAFSYNKLTSVTMPDSVTSIGDRVFFENKLTSVTFSPTSSVSIGLEAFSCNELSSLIA